MGNNLQMPCDFELIGSRSDLKNRNVYNVYVANNNLSATTWHEVVFSGQYVQFKLFSPRHTSNIVVAFDSPSNENIEIFDGLKVNRLFSRLYFKFKSSTERNESPIQLLIGDFKDQIERTSDLKGYVITETETALASGGANNTYDYYTNGRKAKFILNINTAIANRDYRINVTIYSALGTSRSVFYQDDLVNGTLVIEVLPAFTDRIRYVITNNHGATALSYTLETEVS